jgi:hypothetical protein
MMKSCPDQLTGLLQSQQTEQTATTDLFYTDATSQVGFNTWKSVVPFLKLETAPENRLSPMQPEKSEILN